jgi:RNA polymerase sigma-70 factor (ECF subfamily)
MMAHHHPRPSSVRTRADEQAVAFLSGDAAAIGAIQSAVATVVRTFRRLRIDEHDDLVQEAMGRVFVMLRSGRFRGEAALKTCAQRVARYVCLEHLRLERLATQIDLESLPSRERWSGPEEALLLSEERRIGLRALAALSPECRRLFHLIFIEEMTYREVATRLGISETAVKIRVHRCRRAGRGPATRTETRSGIRTPVILPRTDDRGTE